MTIAAAALAACASSPSHAPPSSAGASDAADAGGLRFDAAGPDGPPAADASGLCGNAILPALVDPPNLYFVADRSGSMGQALGAQAGAPTKWVALRKALTGVVGKLGARVNVGAAVYPRTGGALGCFAGGEVFVTRRGDAASGADAGALGATTVAFAASLGLVPSGGTPTAATLAVLYPTVAGLAGRTYVVLATDGAPNCNPAARCDASACEPNLDLQTGCGAATNCCAVGDPAFGPESCVDTDATTTAIAAFKKANIPVYVIGLPSSGGAYYQAVLDRMALAGGTARGTSPRYYPVADVSGLEQVLAAIGAEVALPCDVTLAAEPPDATRVNVYLDDALVAYDAQDGWTWTTPSSFTLHGAACARLESGAVRQVQVVSGCPTQKPS